MNNILFFLTPKAMCSFVYDDYSVRQALEKMEVAHYAALPILNRKGEYSRTTPYPFLYDGHNIYGYIQGTLGKQN